MEESTTLRTEFNAAREQTDLLFRLIRPDSLFERPVPERHRLNFYLGHLEAFDWNMICRHALSMPAFRDDLDQLFAFGIDPGESGLPVDQPGDWPSLEETETYNRQVRETVDKVLDGVPPQVVHVAIEHRLMHAETLCFLLHNFDADRKLAPALPPTPAGPAPPAARIEIPAGAATLGQPRNGDFGWDNEFDELRVEVPAFSIGKHKVTNGEYLAFVEQGAAPPHFWRKSDGGWRLSTMFGECPLPLDWPVYCTHTEASAYAAWKGGSLPTEAQLHRAGYGTPEGEERPYPWGSEPPTPARGNFDFAHWDPIPVTATPAGDSAFGVAQILGNGWEWTADLFRAFPGFQPFAYYPGYSANFFDNDHYVIKGGAPRTAAKLLRRSFRNWFRQGYKYACISFRVVGANGSS